MHRSSMSNGELTMLRDSVGYIVKFHQRLQIRVSRGGPQAIQSRGGGEEGRVVVGGGALSWSAAGRARRAGTRVT